MLSKRAAVAFVLLAAAAAGCGESTAKRSVDARAEVLSFYAADAPVVGLLRPNPGAELRQLDRAAAGLPLWVQLRSGFIEPLEAAGLGMSDLRRLVRPNEEIENVEEAALSFGAPTPTDLTAGQTLTVIATDQNDLLDELLRDGVSSGELQPSGSLDEAALYSNRIASYAERDGVLVSAPSLGVVREAVARRDGDSDNQLDEDVVGATVQELSRPAPLLLYGSVPGLLAEPGLAELAEAPWTESAQDGAAAVAARDDAVEIDVVINLERELGVDERPLPEDPAPVAVQLPGLGALEGSGFSTGDEIRVQLKIASPP